MKLTIFFVGKTDSAFLPLVTDYSKRVGRYITTEVKIIPELKNAKSLTPSLQCEKEGEQLLKAMPSLAEVYLLDENGKQMTSVELAHWFEKRMLMGLKELVLVVGGPYGFSASVRSRATGSLSLSQLTFSHQMVRVILLEQVYRAFTIIKGEPYHHA